MSYPESYGRDVTICDALVCQFGNTEALITTALRKAYADGDIGSVSRLGAQLSRIQLTWRTFMSLQGMEMTAMTDTERKAYEAETAASAIAANRRNES